MVHEPTIYNFMVFTDKQLTPQQIQLAETLIDYRKKHLCMGRQGGRTFVIDEVNRYLDNAWPDHKADKEL